jgi:tubby and related proteins
VCAGTDDAIKLYSNDLFGENGDVLGAQNIPAYQPQPSNNQSGVASSQKLQQQKSMAAQKRLERMQSSGVATNNDAAPRSPRAQGPLTPKSSTLSSMGSMDSVSAPVFARQTSGASTLASQTSTSRGWASPLAGTLDMADEHDPSIEEICTEEAGPTTSSHKQQSKGPVGKNARIEITDVRSFLMTPGPSSRPILCYIVRDKGSAKMYPKYSLFLEDGNRFLLSARKRKKSRSSNYLLSLNNDDLARDAPGFFGKVRSNFVGTDFTIFDKGDKQDSSRQEFGVVTYQYNVLGTRGPRKMTAAIPMLDDHGKRLYKAGNSNEGMLERHAHSYTKHRELLRTEHRHLAG